MESEYREKQRKSYVNLRMIYDLTMALLFLGMAVCMLFADQLRIDFIALYDKVFRYWFGGICVLYGGFRLYRGLKRNY